MNPTVSRFIHSTLAQFSKSYTSDQVIIRLTEEIKLLSSWLMNNEPDTETFRQKSELLKEKRQELENFKNEKY